jgi:TetR/AcrR family transcriptional regulator, transcriptional repressor of bet genes
VNEADRERRRTQIIDAAVRVAVRGGLQAASFRTIAEEAGVSVRLVQYYFTSKDGLLKAVLAATGQAAAARVARHLDALPPDAPPRARAAAILEAFLPLDEPRRRDMLVFVVLRTAALTDPSLASSETLGLADSLTAVLADLLRAAAADGSAREGSDPEAEAVLLVAAVAGIAQGMLAGQLAADEGARLLAYALDRALRPGAPRSGGRRGAGGPGRP